MRRAPEANAASGAFCWYKRLPQNVWRKTFVAKCLPQNVWRKKIATRIFVENILITLESQYPTILHLIAGRLNLNQ
jgi:hypothetical protein